MTKKRGDNAKDKVRIEEKWNPPHTDAESFVNDLLDKLKTWEYGEYPNARESQLQSELDEKESQSFALYDMLFENPLDEVLCPPELFDKEMIRFFEIGHEIETLESELGLLRLSTIDADVVDLFYLNENLEIAKTALVRREVDDLFEALRNIINCCYFRSDKLRDKITNVVENWTSVLDYPAVTGEAQEHEDDAVEALITLAVRSLTERLCELIAKHPVALRNVEWRNLEYVIATALDKIGFNVQLTPATKDGGKDVIASCKLSGKKLVFYIEIKHWRSGKRVDSRTIFDFVEVNVIDRTNGGLFVSSSGYTISVYSQLAEINRQRIRLGNEDKIVSLCQHFVRKNQGIWRPVQSLPLILYEKTIRGGNY